MVIWDMLGAIIGAGFVSGREIAAFFAQYGAWGYAGAVVSVLSLVWLSSARLPSVWKEKWMEVVWKYLLTALLMVVGGAMLSASGAVMELILPLPEAYFLGMAVTMLIAWGLARKTSTGLAGISKLMIFSFMVVLICCVITESQKAFGIRDDHVFEAIAKGGCYGGFNAALLIPMINHDTCSSTHDKRKAMRFTGLITTMLLTAGIAVLQSHPAILNEPLPFIQLMKNWGKVGYCLSAGCLYLGALSTLTACIRSLGKGVYTTGCIILIALLGFGSVVEYAYTVIGCVCMVFLMAAKLRNISTKDFSFQR